MLPQFIHTILTLVLLALLGFNLSQRNHIHHGEAKRFATLYIALLFLFLFVADTSIRNWSLPPWTMAAAVFIAVAVAYYFRERIFLFRRRCIECGQNLPLKTTLYIDDNLCDTCRRGTSWPYESENRMDPEEVPKKAEEVDWESLDHSEIAVLCYVISGDKVLLIHKKRGLGEGMVNAPGGRIDAGESAKEAAIRELEEEVGITPEGLYEVAYLNFLFTNGFSLHGTVFFAHSYSGELRETEEADPFWISISDIPYDKMWEDDKYWLPKTLSGYFVEGKFIFEDEKLLSSNMEQTLMESSPMASYTIST